MKIADLETFHAQSGWKSYHFVKLTLENGIIGWSEYDESLAPTGVTIAINSAKRRVIGQDVMQHEGIYARMAAATRQSPTGVLPRANGAIENALLDAKAKLLDIPCYELLGGAVRDRVRVYWSHCGTWRISRAEYFPPGIRNLDDVVALGREVRQSGFSALKTNIFRATPQGMVGWSPGFGFPPGEHGRTPSREVLNGLHEYLSALREGTGPDIDILLDLNYNCRTEGYLSILRKLSDLDIFWVEIDTQSASALATVRNQSPFTVSGCESLTGLVEYLPYFQQEALDVAIIDLPWIGTWQSLKIAAAADAFQVNVAPHNYYGHLATLMAGHFSMVVPNFKIMETDIDRVPDDKLVYTAEPRYIDGYLNVPDTPGWGVEPVPERLSVEIQT
ncbi:MAG: mandelate racemase/muconate lactonizing enzyme family protein [Gammaproteobacteria bacterium]|nr:mandelate racemase/muconate lactonizing enzyme family protein [Gammaproteobacteria bacterium]